MFSGAVAAIAGLNPITSAIYTGVDKSLSTAAQTRLIKYVNSLDKRISELELIVPENMQPELSELLETILVDVQKPQNAKKGPTM
ncbi:hypothetical protein BKY29_05665 [Weissella confusa]|uniref:hypothetical protein n=1 Tax=Weissella confusa TaxID=1583 RepID=UPI0008FDB910|nr:hypothetical protein [Weissella confusa]OJF03617.1 hypothetical protein BKY29_05665 [Weissella confusa]